MSREKKNRRRRRFNDSQTPALDQRGIIWWTWEHPGADPQPWRGPGWPLRPLVPLSTHTSLLSGGLLRRSVSASSIRVAIMFDAFLFLGAQSQNCDGSHGDRPTPESMPARRLATDSPPQPYLRAMSVVGPRYLDSQEVEQQRPWDPPTSADPPGVPASSFLQTSLCLVQYSSQSSTCLVGWRSTVCARAFARAACNASLESGHLRGCFGSHLCRCDAATDWLCWILACGWTLWKTNRLSATSWDLMSLTNLTTRSRPAVCWRSGPSQQLFPQCGWDVLLHTPTTTHHRERWKQWLKPKELLKSSPPEARWCLSKNGLSQNGLEPNKNGDNETVWGDPFRDLLKIVTRIYEQSCGWKCSSTWASTRDSSHESASESRGKVVSGRTKITRAPLQ